MDKDLVQIKKENDGDVITCCSDGQHYPYGTSLHINDDLIDDLGIGQLAVEDVVEIKAVAFVNSKSENSSSGGEESKSMGIQITGMKIKRKSEDDAVKVLYGG